MNEFNKKLKFFIIVFIILIIIVGIVIIVYGNIKKEEEKQFFESHPTILEKKSLNDEVTTNEYYIVKDCINKYYKTVHSIGHTDTNGNVVDNEYKQYKASQLLDILNDDFINEYKLNSEKIIKLYENNDFDSFTINNIYSEEQSNNTSLYVIYGKQINLSENISEKSGLIVLVNYSNNTYSIIPYDYMNKLGYGDKSSLDNYKGLAFKEKKESNNNVIELKTLSEIEIAQDIFKEFKLYSKYDAEFAYDLLEEEYKKERFENVSSGAEYLSKKICNLLGYKLEKMSTDESDPYYTRYVCLDNNGNYFIIKKDDQLMKYSIILDIYTIPVKEVTEKYNNSNNAQKTAINIEKFKQMINLKDYNSAYNVLDETFRNNNFGSVEKFEKYIKQNWPEYISIKCSNYNEVNDVGTMDIKITERGVYEEELNRVIEKTFIVKLLDDNNFVMSFNVDE